VIRHVPPRRLRLFPVRRVTLHAITRTQRIAVVHMALRTRRRGMRARQRKSRDAVIERRRVPSRRCVALRTIPCGKCLPRGRVRRIIRLLPCRQVALRVTAIGRLNRQIIVTVHMARTAWGVCVPIGQLETRRAVVEFPVGPFGNRMAGRASSRG